MVQCVGAVVVFFAARMCHAAFVTSIAVWYASPTNRHKYYKACSTQVSGLPVSDIGFRCFARHCLVAPGVWGFKGKTEQEAGEA